MKIEELGGLRVRIAGGTDPQKSHKGPESTPLPTPNRPGPGTVRTKTNPAGDGVAVSAIADVPNASQQAAANDGEFDIDAVVASVKSMIQVQMQAIETSHPARMRWRRNARTLGQLVRSMERIEALEKRREKKGRKTMSGEHAELNCPPPGSTACRPATDSR